MLFWINPNTLKEENIAVPGTDDGARNLLRFAPHADELVETFDEYRDVLKKSRKEALLSAAERAREIRMEEATERQRLFNEERARRRHEGRRE